MDKLGEWEEREETGHSTQTHWRRSVETALGYIGEDIFQYGKRSFQAEVYINDHTIKWQRPFKSVRAAKEWCNNTLRPAIEKGIEDLKKLI